MRTKAIAFLILATLILSSGESTGNPIGGIGGVISGSSGKFKPYEEGFKKEGFKSSLDFYKDYAHKYLKEVYKVVKGENVKDDGTYTKLAKSYDNTAALLGFHFDQAWKGEKPKPKEESETIKDQVREALIKAFLKREDEGLAKLGSDALQTQTKALAALLMAGISYGHIINPNEDHPQNYKDNKKPYYGFRLGQQAIRNAILESYTIYVINLSSEVAWFYDKINKYCPSSITDDQKVNLGGVDSDKDFSGVPRPNPTPATGIFPISFMQVYGLMVKQLAGLGNVECLKLMAQLTHMKIELANAQMMLAILATQYSMLNNQEKGWLR